MEREFNAETLYTMSELLKQRANDLKYEGDTADFGNEVGIIVGEILVNMSETEIRDFVNGFRHGVSLTNGSYQKRKYFVKKN